MVDPPELLPSPLKRCQDAKGALWLLAQKHTDMRGDLEAIQQILNGKINIVEFQKIIGVRPVNLTGRQDEGTHNS